jgi:Zn-dependent protease with chaperone function
MSKLLAVLLIIAFAAVPPRAAAAAATRIVAVWKAEQVSGLTTEVITLRTKDGVQGIFERSHIVHAMDALSRVQASAELPTELLIVHLSDSSPNAFAKVVDGKQNIVGISIAMLDLIGDDADAYAAIFGHELAHIVKDHGSGRAARQGFLQALSIIGGFAIAAATGFNPGRLIDLGATLVDRTFSREEERDADKLGFDYMVKAGFDPEGAIRAHEKMLSAVQSRPVAFLSTHPGGEERLSNFRRMIAALPSPVPSAAPSPPQTREQPQAAAPLSPVESPRAVSLARVVDARWLLLSSAKAKLFIDRSGPGAAPDIAEVSTTIEAGDGSNQEDTWTVMCTDRRIYSKGYVQRSATGEERTRQNSDPPRLVWPNGAIPVAERVLISSLFGVCVQRVP